ncbi:MAG: large subunit ribosomal protein [Thermomicrobiales bacterium]|jgi:large subunit ribosomal protein L6|nr:large subunit ribosomal protein [Thermomicrobiales bacterium]
MSRIGRKPIPLPAAVDVVIDQGNVVTVKGPRGQLAATFAPSIVLERENGSLNVSRPDDSRQNRSLHGLTRTLLSNMVTGVTEGFRKNLEIQGVGYRAAMDGKTLVLSVGYSHPVRMTPPDGVTYTLDGLTKVAVLGSDKQLVGEEAARIRRVRPPEPYKGKGIRYEGEQVRRKAGKTGKAK